MPFKDIFKRKPKEEPVQKKEKPEESVEKVGKVEKEKKEAAKPAKKEKKAIAGFAYRILKSPHVTEKAGDLTSRNQYIFKVYPQANKVEVKKAIEDIFGVDVVGVRIINVPRKKRRLGRVEGFRKGYKKAIVRIKEGQKIEIMPK